MAIKTSTSRTNNATENSKSRYVQGGTTDRYPNRLGWWERKALPFDDTDVMVTVLPNEDRRPDLLAFRMYGSDSSLEWLVLQYNSIVDIQTEFTTGTELRLPSQRRVMLGIMTKSTGGKIIKT